MTVNALIDELLDKELWNLEHGLIDVEVAAKVLEAAGPAEVARYFRQAADRVRRHAWAESTRMEEARMRAFQEESERMAVQALTVACTQCRAAAGEPCVTPNKDRTKKPHKRRVRAVKQPPRS